MDELSPTAFVARRAAGEDLTLLDVREPWELELARVPGVVHIPMGQIPARYRELDPNRPTVVLCGSGARSLQVAAFLTAHGFRSVANLTGGTLAWRAEVDPTLAAY